ncbi:MAG: DUF4339 domain-containing protein [Deltaproteobacteria bacterium]|nr:DUF4339 domain-containing protein [Deltaproteobacteria bacterium]
MPWEEDEEDEATHIFGGNDPVLDVTWQVNVSETETRAMLPVDIGIEFGRGKLDTNDTFVWREGMRDWLPLGKCPELLPILNQFSGQRAQSVAPPPPPRNSIAPAAPLPVTNYAVPTIAPMPLHPAPAPRSTQASMPFATPSALSAGQSPLRGPMPSNPAMQTGAFTGAAAAQEAAAAQAAAQAQAGMMPQAFAPQPKSSGKTIALVAGGVAIVAAAAGTAFFLVRSRTGTDTAASAAPTASTATPALASAATPATTTASAATTAAVADAASAAPSAEPIAMLGAQPPKGINPTGFSAPNPTLPKKEDEKKDTKPLAEFNVEAARSALASAAGAAGGCGKPGGPKGRGKATVWFSPSGSVSSVSTDAFSGTPVGNCVMSAFRSARVPPFSGSVQSVSKSFTVK